MKKSLYFLAAAALVMTGCSSDDYVGGPSEVENTTGSAIVFSGINPNITRADATGSNAANKLTGSFNVYGTKSFADRDDVNVFAQNEYSATANAPFWVWWADNAGSTDSNEKGWEYVGTADVISAAVAPAEGDAAVIDQTIKYWDYAADEYDFIAYSATKPGLAKVTEITNTGFKVSATAEGLAGLYIADYKTVKEANYNKTVTFMFRAAGTKVRLGIYETVPGYDVRNIAFRYNNDAESSTEMAWLDGSFIGSMGAEDFCDATVSYAKNEEGGMPVVTFDNAENSPAVRKMFCFGAFDSSTKIKETSADPTWANGGYMDVMPNVVNVGPMTLHVNYELVNTVTGEVINVTNAKAVVPAQYMVWNPNYAYTYLFKISDNTNGTTGDEDDDDPEGLYPITFDAVVAETVVDETQGTITTVATPQITTYQDGSVSGAGIAYAVSSENPIYVTVSEAGECLDLTIAETAANLYSVVAGTTEAELVLGTVDLGTATQLTAGDALKEVNLVKFEANKYVELSGLAAGTYAFEYTYPGYKLTKDTEIEGGKVYYTDAAGTVATGLVEGEKTTQVLYEDTTLKAYKVIVVE